MNDRISVSFKEVDNFVREQNEKGNIIKWDGWCARIFRKDSRATTDPHGTREGTEWGYAFSVPLETNGKEAFYSFPKKLLV